MLEDLEQALDIRVAAGTVIGTYVSYVFHTPEKFLQSSALE